MTFKRLNEDTVCCILSQEDMNSYDMDLEDFIVNREKAEDVLHDIVERAVEEVGFDVKSGFVSIQIVPLPDNGISILFSEKSDINVEETIKKMRSVLGSLSEAGKSLENLVQDKENCKEKDGGKEKDREKGKDKSKEKDKSKGKAKNKAGSTLRIYEFASMDKVIAFASGISTQSKVISRLYKEQRKGTYFLVFERGKLSKKEFACVCTNAVEFGTFVSDSAVRAAYMEEHMEVIIEEKALKVLRKFAKESN